MSDCQPLRTWLLFVSGRQRQSFKHDRLSGKNGRMMSSEAIIVPATAGHSATIIALHVWLGTYDSEQGRLTLATRTPTGTWWRGRGVAVSRRTQASRTLSLGEMGTTKCVRTFHFLCRIQTARLTLYQTPTFHYGSWWTSNASLVRFVHFRSGERSYRRRTWDVRNGAVPR